jgi:hypothetical protein
VPALDQLVAKHDRVILRKVNIGSWDTDAWKQARGEYNSRGIPLIAIYDGKGIYRGTVQASPSEIAAAVEKALAE